MAEDKEKEEREEIPQLPKRIRHLPEWETPVNPPKRTRYSRLSHQMAMKRASISHRHSLSTLPYGAVSPITTTTITASADPYGVCSPTTASTNGFFHQKEPPNSSDNNESILLPTHTSAHGHPSLPTTPPHDDDINAPSTRRRGLSARLNAIFPPTKTHCGLARRPFLLFVLLPVILLVILAFALGLGLGLRHRNTSATPTTNSDLPLPSNGQKTYTGDLTYYNLGLGACGETSSNADMAVAVAHSLFDAAALEGSTNPNENPLCGRTIRVSRDYAEIGAGVISVLVKVVDRCVGCEPTDLDLSPAVYDLFAPEEKGRVPGQWNGLICLDWGWVWVLRGLGFL